MTASRIYHGHKLSRLTHGRIEPMREEDRVFWQWRAERKEKENNDE